MEPMEVDEPLPVQPPIAKHDSSVLDLAFAMDCTGSMNTYISTARDNIRFIVESIVASEKSDVNLALVEYRDHPPQENSFVTRPHDFTSSVSTMKEWLEGCSASGGGDAPEAVADALNDLLKLSWRENATKIAVLISDAPPHGLALTGDKFPNGCPAGLDPMTIVRQLSEKGITLYVVGCEPAINAYKDFFMAIAYMTGGQYTPLRGAKALTQIIIGGAQEEISLERWMQEVDREIQAEMLAGNRIDDDEMTKRVEGKLKHKGAHGTKLMRNNADLEDVSATSKGYAGLSSMAEVRSVFKPFGDSKSNGRVASACAEEDLYGVQTSAITSSQASRMVQKSKARNNYY